MEEEQQKVEKQKEINVIGLMKAPEEFRKMFEELKKMASERLQAHEFQSAIDYYLKCIDMLDLGKNLLSNMSPFTKASLFINMAAAYQGAWKIQKCNKFCEKGEEELLKLINQENKEQYLKITKHLVTLKFQHCAILSQLNQHEKALETCKSTLRFLEQTVSVIYNYSKRQEDSYNAKCSDEGVMFSRKVYGLASQILSTLTQQLNETIEPKQSKSSIFYFWQRNPQKNEEQLKKIFLPQNNMNSKRSILGVNKQNHWVDEFNIGSIMRMSQIKAQTFQKNLPMEEYLFKDKLYEIVIHCSLAFFTIATQMRFIDAQKNGEAQELKSDKEINRFENIRKKYGYEEKSEMFKLSEGYHLRAIEIVSLNIQAPIPYLTHMIKSYDKHYVFKKKLQEIAAIGDQSVLQMSSIVNPSASKHSSKLNPDKNKNFIDRAYGDEITAINGQFTEDQVEHYNDYLDSNQNSNKKTEIAEVKRESKELRNTARYSHSHQHEDLKGRTKSVGKLRKKDHKNTTPKQPKQQNNQKAANQLKTGKKKKQKEVIKQKQDKFKKTRIKIPEYEGQGELHVRTKSSTHIKFVFKKKK